MTNPAQLPQRSTKSPGPRPRRGAENPGRKVDYAAANAALTALEACGSVARSEPRFAGWSLAVAEAVAAGPLQVAVVGDGPGAEALASVARQSGSPGMVVVHGMPDAAGVPLLADRPLVEGAAAAYVCRGFVCDRPVTSPDELRAALGEP